MPRILLLVFIFFSASVLNAQSDSSAQAMPAMSFEDMDSKPVKRFATQKVLNQSPNRFISIGYEYQGGYDFKASPAPFNETLHYNNTQAIRLGLFTPIVSKNNLIINLGANYHRTLYNGTGYSFPYPLYQPLNNLGLHSAGLSLTVFKPLNEKNFMIFQLMGDANWQQFEKGKLAVKDAVTVSGSIIYGWKPSENLIWGLGVSRTYRLGRPLLIPVLLYNQTFNEHWGIESVFPAKAAIRRNINKKSMLFAGYELEGNQYALNTLQTTYLQRGEIRPRISYERKLLDYWWISIQAGLRMNGRFNTVDRYNGKQSNEVVKTTMGNALFFNISINMVSL